MGKVKFLYEKIKSLKAYHVALAVICVLTVLAIITMKNWSEFVVRLPIAFAICFDDKYEKQDELEKQNICKVNTVVMWLMLVAFGIFGMYARYHVVPVEAVFVVICSAIAIRSIIFICFDTTFGNREEVDE